MITTADRASAIAAGWARAAAKTNEETSLELLMFRGRFPKSTGALMTQHFEFFF